MATITKRYQAGLKSPFQVRWRVDGKYRSRYFENSEAQGDFAQKLSEMLGADAPNVLSLERHELRDIAKAYTLKRPEVSFTLMAEFWNKHHRDREQITLWNAADLYLRTMKQSGDRSIEYLKHVRKQLEHLCDTYGETLLERIARPQLEEWLNNLPYGPITKRNYRSGIRAAWSFFEKKGWVDAGVASKLNVGKAIHGEIGILTVEETEKLMRANEDADPEVAGLLALGLFAGMRTSAVSRVAYDEINFADRGIETPAAKTKKKRRHYIENLPDNLWAWLKRTPQSAFSMDPRHYRHRISQAFRRAGLLVTKTDVKRLAKKGITAKPQCPPHNCCRHSFVSYHVALHRNFTDTALIISHKGTDILFEHYLGVAKKEDAARYFEIYPRDFDKVTP